MHEEPATGSRRVAGVVLAAGSGTRLGAPKQFLALTPSERLVDAAVRTVLSVADHVTVVLPAGTAWDGKAVDAVVTGGESRIESVRAALDVLPSDVSVVVIADAAHPLASEESTRSCIAAVDGGADAAIPWLEVADVVKRLQPDGSLSTVGRGGLGTAQVPAAFRRSTLVDAHAATTNRPTGDPLWEDTQLIEAIGGRVVVVPGDPANVHVVDAPSLELARLIAASRPRG